MAGLDVTETGHELSQHKFELTSLITVDRVGPRIMLGSIDGKCVISFRQFTGRQLSRRLIQFLAKLRLSGMHCQVELM